MAILKDHRLRLVILLGLALRALTMTLPGTDDMYTNQLWGARALERGIASIYIYDDSYLMDRAVSRWKGAPYPAVPVVYQTEIGLLDHTPNYPPLSLYLFWLCTWACRFLQGGRLALGGLLNACFNFVPVLCALATALVAWAFFRKEGLPRPLLAVAAFWLNPVMLFHTPVLGYVDSVFTLLGFCSLILLYRRQFTGAVVFLALSCMTKPQGVLILPVAAAAIVAEKNWGLVRRLAGVFVLVALAPFMPFILTGHSLAAIRGNYQVLGLPFLSSQQTNLWWLASWLLPAIAQRNFNSLGQEVSMVPQQVFQQIIHLDAPLVAFALLGAFAVSQLFFLWKELNRGNRLSIFWAAALGVCGFTMLSLYPHENHLYPFFVYGLPLIALSRRTFLNLYIALTVEFGLNIYLFDGLGRGMTDAAQSLRMWPGFDLTVAVSLFYLVVFVWIARAPRWYFDITGRSLAGAVLEADRP